MDQSIKYVAEIDKDITDMLGQYIAKNMTPKNSPARAATPASAPTSAKTVKPPVKRELFKE